jgi:hypothetical protein
MPEDNGANQNQPTPAEGQPGVATGTEPNGAGGEGTTPASGQPDTPKWLSQLPDELKGDERLAGFNSLGEAMKTLLDGSKTSTEGDGSEGQEGDPSPVDYEFSKDFPETVDPEGVVKNTLKEAFGEMKLSKEQADKLYSNFVDSFNGIEEKMKNNAAEKCEQALKDNWGDKYDENLASMKRAYKSLVPEGSDLEKGLEMTLAKNNPYVIDLLAQVGKSISEHDPPRSSAVGEIQESNGFLRRENEKYPW